MIERREHFRLALKPGQAFGIGRHGRREHLEGDGPFQVRVGGPVDLAHPARADHREDFVGADPGARGEAHVPWEVRGLYGSPGQLQAS